MLTATLLALGAAVLHAGWNLAVKQTRHDRFIALWAQFGIGGAIALVALIATGGMPSQGWKWAVLSGCVHLPYTLFLSRAYASGDFSQVYPVARGSGAFLAAIGGIVLLGDPAKAWTIAAIVIIACGLMILAGRARGPAVITAIGVGCTICAYTLLDSKGSRVTQIPGSSVTKDVGYGLATAIATTVSLSAYGLSTGRFGEVHAALRVDWRKFTLAGIASLITYTLVLVAVRYASVGYVTALRESSVVLAALIGWRFLGEGNARRRLTATAIVLVGLITLVTLGR
ncbi:MAG: multidrug transporter permease [Ilumatobacteraceae bacterium]|nr:multidrug transporter permease [Ilumatobacteraceae bacterium]